MTTPNPLLQPARFAALPAFFHTPVRPSPLQEPRVVIANTALAREMGLGETELGAPATIALLSGQPMHGGVTALATRYGGHQFGVWAGQLGDGRALLLGDRLCPDGQRLEVQLKGAGVTPFSRMGDGRAVLRSSIREYLCSEAMHALGIPTTRALLLTSSDDPVYRERVESAAIVTRLAPSFIRFGHFELLYHQGRHEDIRVLADFVIDHYYPECRLEPQPYRAFFAAVLTRTAGLMAAWQSVGFCHGVMNSDNMSILGLTLDYGPFGFLDGFDAAHVCNHSDHSGRYAYQQQPQVALWNLYCLATSLLPVVSEPELRAELARYDACYQAAYLTRFRAKLGLEREQTADAGLIESLLQALHAGRTDFTIFFRTLAGFDVHENAVNAALLDLFVDRDAGAHWLAQYRSRLLLEDRSAAARRLAMLAVNPAYVLRNHLAEQAIRQAQDDGDDSGVQALAACLAQPFTERAEFAAFAALPPSWAAGIEVS
ncbi:protein adenylyltransferase SelO, partial [Craterilacuibacter sp.]|uniref:protein adenylyltransferase SelO n=1 Tax=Craterilacuibacter sp. TaxID=2870909 RepID=UPI003F39FCC8